MASNFQKRLLKLTEYQTFLTLTISLKKYISKQNRERKAYFLYKLFIN